MKFLTTVAIALAVATAPAINFGNLMPLGDSITRGTTEGGGYRAPLYDLLRGSGHTFAPVGPRTDANWKVNPTEVQHAGFPSWRTSDLAFGRPSEPLAGNVAQWMTTYQPDTIILMVGTNDSAVYKNDPAGMRARYNELLDVIFGVDPGVRLFMANITPGNSSYGDHFDHYMAHAGNVAQMVPEIVAERQLQGRTIHFVDMFTALDPDTDIADLVHPNLSGYRKMAGQWSGAMNAVPEPSSMAALAALGALAIRRKRPRSN